MKPTFCNVCSALDYILLYFLAHLLHIKEYSNTIRTIKKENTNLNKKEERLHFEIFTQSVISLQDTQLVYNVSN